ncbi:MAG: PQQ-binding-like beta-propeller repeat protein [Flavobacterium sp.]
MRKYLSLAIAIFLGFFSCEKSDDKTPISKVDHNTLLLATEGQLINFNLDENKIAWEYKSNLDTVGNRNYFVVDGQNLFMPFESGQFVNFDVNTGKIIWKKQVSESDSESKDSSNDENAENQRLKELMPLLMTTPKIDGAQVLIATTAQPTQGVGYLFNYNKSDGKEKWRADLPTVFNLFAPVKYRNNYFVNSAVYLEMFTPQSGTSTSYEMFEGAEVSGEEPSDNQTNQFEKPIYTQMQANDESLFIGDESGKFYCFQLDKNANLNEGDMMDPNNTFIKNPKVFKWTFSDRNFDFQENGITFLDDNTLFVEMKTGLADKSCIYALDTNNGKVKWKKVVQGSINNWNLKDGKIMGSTDNIIFWLDNNGENYSEMPTKNKLLSNIDLADKANLIYVTENGIETLDIKTKKTKLTFAKAFRMNNHNNLQIKYIGK